MPSTTAPSVSRRTALAGLGAGSLGVALAVTARPASAQDAAADALAGHPLVGTWLAITPFGASPETFAADGSFVAGPPIAEPGPAGVQFLGPAIGVWASTGARSGAATFVQALADATGTYTGTLTIDAHLAVSEDGQSFVDDSAETTITIRDTAHAVVQTIKPYEAGDGGVPPVTAIRMAVGAPGFPAGTPAATPTS